MSILISKSLRKKLLHLTNKFFFCCNYIKLLNVCLNSSHGILNITLLEIKQIASLKIINLKTLLPNILNIQNLVCFFFAYETFLEINFKPWQTTFFLKLWNKTF